LNFFDGINSKKERKKTDLAGAEGGVVGVGETDSTLLGVIMFDYDYDLMD